MKIKSLTRPTSSFTRETVDDIKKISRNLNPALHPMQRGREYARAVVGSKLDKMHAKPFVGALSGHYDGVSATSQCRGNLTHFVSGGCDGEIRLWDLSERVCVAAMPTAHRGWVRGVVVAPDGRSFFSCSDDKTIKRWNFAVDNYEKKRDSRLIGNAPANTGAMVSNDRNTPAQSWLHKAALKSIDHHWKDESFAVGTDISVDIYSHARSDPLQSFQLWGDDSVNIVKYNPAEANLLAHTSSDRGIGLYDLRMNVKGGATNAGGLQKTTLGMKSNCLEWNPMEPFNFTVGNEDHNAYTFDMRKLDAPIMIHKGHIGAVLSIAWASTGREFATGSYDRTVRIFKYRDGGSRDMYHAKRMQRIFTVNYTPDSRFIVSGSDDTNLRLWKSKSNEKMGQALNREEKSTQYRETLVKKFSHMPELKKISKNSTHTPKFVKKQTAMKQVQKESAAKKVANRIKHTKPGKILREGERHKVVLKKQD
jgi:WD repeat and SOF domain-containing protein 1